MLILSRKQGERIVIDRNVVVTVVELGRDRVRLGIEAPPQVAVHREEVLQRILAEERSPVEEHAAEAESPFFSECA